MKRIVFLTVAVAFAVLLVASATEPAAASSSTYYVVRRGDTLYSIASRFGVSTWSIASANRLWNPNVIYAGQTLLIPGINLPYPPDPYPGPIYRCMYQVRYGDTMYSIARRLGTDVWALARANGIYNTNWVYSGQWLRVPGCYS